MSTKRIAVTALVAVAVIGGALALWRSGGSADSSGADRQANAVPGVATGTDAAAARITATIYRIDRLKLDPSVLSSPAYLSLVDRSQPIPEEPIGRPDPFAPLYQDAVATTSGRAQGQGGLLNQNQGAGQAKASTSTAPAR